VSLTSRFDLTELCCRPVTTPVDEKNFLPVLVHSGLRNKTSDFENFNVLGKILEGSKFSSSLLVTAITRPYETLTASGILI
jgi:hypothetical protein